MGNDEQAMVERMAEAINPWGLVLAALGTLYIWLIVRAYQTGPGEWVCEYGDPDCRQDDECSLCHMERNSW
ncbi:hypothetical protein [Croceibacterium ferulae]|uniref:hypothetical protein n=1 Tax=Croceibacterium ferulae TaxID=1854641 RepID=UPI000EB3FC69|nr:hypothetical protein [Croceibacterium ferulae]